MGVKISYDGVEAEVDTVEQAAELVRLLKGGARVNGASPAGTTGAQTRTNGTPQPPTEATAAERSIAILTWIDHDGVVPVSEVVRRYQLDGPKSMGNVAHWIGRTVHPLGLTFKDVIQSRNERVTPGGRAETVWKKGSRIREAVTALTASASGS